MAPMHLASINLFPEVLYFITRDKRTDVTILNNNGFTARGITYLALENQITFRKLLTHAVLRKAGVPMKVNDILRSRHQEQAKANSGIKDMMNTRLVVATLMVTVTFAAGFTVAGGAYSSDDPNPKNRGMAVLGHKPLFWVFTTFNTVAMYTSVLACGLMLQRLKFDNKLAAIFTITSSFCLAVAFLTVPVAFMAAISLVVANNSALALLIIVIGVPYTFLILFLLCYNYYWIFSR